MGRHRWCCALVALVCLGWPALALDRAGFEAEIAKLRGPLGQLVHVDRLDWMAEKYVMQMAFSKSIRHDLIEPDMKTKWARWAEAALPITNAKYDLYEILAFTWKDATDYHVAHIWDKSQYHAWVLYNPRALWYGYASTVGADGNLYICMYIVVLYIGVSIDDMRELPLSGD